MWHRRLIDDLRRILRTIENNEGMDVLLKVLEGAFGPRSAAAIQQDHTQRRQVNRAAGRVTLISSAAAARSVSLRARTLISVVDETVSGAARFDLGSESHGTACSFS